MKILKKFLPFLIFTLFLQSCGDDDNNTTIETNTIADLAIATPQLSVLTEALIRADLVSTLRGDDTFTVLAPRNEAFTAFLQAKGFASLDDVPTATLRKILLNHVIASDLKSTDLTTGYANTLATSAASGDPLSIYVDTSSGVKFNGTSEVINPDIEASNGTVHIVNSVIDIPNIVTFATADAELSILVDALTRSDLTTNFVSILSTNSETSPAPFTVFAPKNDAFVSLLTELQANALGDIATATLDATLKNHVIAETNARAEDLSDNFTVNTLTSEIEIDVTGGARITDANNRVSNITNVNIQADNGVVHKIDKVILPPLQ